VRLRGLTAATGERFARAPASTRDVSRFLARTLGKREQVVRPVEVGFGLEVLAPEMRSDDELHRPVADANVVGVVVTLDVGDREVLEVEPAGRPDPLDA